MAEEEIGTEEELDGQGDATDDGQGEGGKTRANPARRANRNLRRARSLYVKNGWEPSNEAAFLLQEANMLILMDLAEAIRGRVEAAD